MATLDEVNEILRNLRADATTFRNSEEIAITLPQGEYTLANSEVDDYLVVRAQIAIDPETAVFAPGYYEHLVDVPGSRAVLIRSRGFEEQPIELTSADGQMSIKLGPLSTRFLLIMLDRLESHNLREFVPRGIRSRYGSGRVVLEGKEPHLRDLFSRYLTIQLTATDGFRSRAKQAALHAIAEAGLFNISFARGIGLSLSRSWERNHYRLGTRRLSSIPFPRKTYKPDLVAYYQLALASDSSILAYLSLYKILEYFFVSTAETVLHQRLKDKLAAPDFHPKLTPSLREVTSLVRKFDQRTDEKKMLTGVLEHYFMVDEIAMWIADREQAEGRYFTTPQTLLGINHCIDLSAEILYSSMATRIYHIRNALVHNKEGDLPRFIPFSEHDEVLMKELPLIMFLTEQLIIKTGQDI